MVSVLGCAKTRDPVQLNNSCNEGAAFTKAFRINDMNERALFFYNLCLKKNEPVHEKFLDNFDVVIRIIIDICVQEEWAPEYILSQIVNRRKETRLTLENHYKIHGCYSREAISAHDHYHYFGSLKKEFIKSMVLN
jgi:hypothetical protein